MIYEQTNRWWNRGGWLERGSPKHSDGKAKRILTLLRTTEVLPENRPSVRRISRARCRCLLELVALPELCLCPDVNPGAARSSVSVWFHSDAAQLTHESPVTLGERPHAWVTAEEVAKTHCFSPRMLCYLSAVQPVVGWFSGQKTFKVFKFKAALINIFELDHYVLFNIKEVACCDKTRENFHWTLQSCSVGKKKLLYFGFMAPKFTVLIHSRFSRFQLQ